MIERLSNLDRRWIFLAMLLSVAVPIYVLDWLDTVPPEKPTPLAQSTFDEIENLPAGSRLVMAFDFDPASEGELGPMATSFVRHAAEKGHKLYFLALWPVGPQMIEQSIRQIIRADFPEMIYGRDYVNLGFKAGNEAVIKVVMTDLGQTFSTDAYGTPLEAIPMMEGIRNLQNMDLIVNVSAGYPGTKEWVQYAATPYRDQVRLVAGCTGVQAPLLYPYIPEQLPGLLGAIKGAAEYEYLVNRRSIERRYEAALIDAGHTPADAFAIARRLSERRGAAAEYVADGDGASLPAETRALLVAIENEPIAGKYLEGQRRMGPQLVAHLLMILLIIAGNTIFFLQRRRGGGAR